MRNELNELEKLDLLAFFENAKHVFAMKDASATLKSIVKFDYENSLEFHNFINSKFETGIFFNFNFGDDYYIAFEAYSCQETANYSWVLKPGFTEENKLGRYLLYTNSANYAKEYDYYTNETPEIMTEKFMIAYPKMIYHLDILSKITIWNYRKH